MHTKRIIPCLDVKNGRVVKGVNFVNLIDAGDPVAVGAAYDKAGADELVFLDITASSDQRNIVVDMVRRVAETIFIPFTVGGGIRTVDDFKAILREGADKISVNSAAIDNPTLIADAADKFGSQCDGTKAGYDIELTRTIADNVNIPVIASGGAGTKDHFYDALTEGSADAALAASLFHYKELEIGDLKRYLQDKGIPMRL